MLELFAVANLANCKGNEPSPMVHNISAYQCSFYSDC
jgi:hypothetical protein